MRSRILRAVFLVLCLYPATGTSQDAPTSGQRLALYTKPAVVRILGAWIGEFRFNNRTWREAIGGSGSGFFISPDGYIATNAHVVDVIQTGEEKAKEALLKLALQEIFQTYKADLVKLNDEQRRQLLSGIQMTGIKKINFVIQANGAQAGYDIKAYGAPVGEGKDCAIIKISAKNAPTLRIGDSQRMQLQDSVYVIGYPGVADIAGVLDEKSQLEASITDGHVSAFKNTQEGDQVIQVTTPISHGNSGGPAVNEQGEVVGLATFTSAKEVQGFNFLVSSTTLSEYVRQAGSTNAQSETDRVWREALDLYWAHRYTKAIERMEEVITLYAPHSEARKMMDRAREERRIRGEGLPTALIFLIGGVVVAAGSGVGVWQWQKRGQRRRGTGTSSSSSGQIVSTRPLPARAGGPSTSIPETMAISALAPPPDEAVAETMFVSDRRATVTCTRGVLSGQRFSVTAGGLLIGRKPGVAHVVIQDPRVSGEHVWIRWEDDELVAVDQGTTNGTFVNGMQNRISRSRLKSGDVLIVANPDCLSLSIKIG